MPISIIQNNGSAKSCILSVSALFQQGALYVILLTMIQPEVGTALVELSKSSIPTPEKSYDSVMSGRIIALHPEDMKLKSYLLHRIGYWRQFKDDLRVSNNQALIEIKDILGSSPDESTDT
jgi:hypothetical protein